MSIKAKPPTVLWAVRRLGSGFWVGVRWLVLSGFGVLALVNIWGLLALARVGSSAIVEANMVGWNLQMRGSYPAGGSRGRTGQFGWTNGHYCRSEMLR